MTPTLSKPIAQPKPSARLTDRVAYKKEREEKARVFRMAVWSRDKGRCRVCPKRSCHLHHLLPRSRGGKWTTGNIVALCARCHQLAHSGMLYLSGNPDVSLYWEFLSAPLPQRQKPWGYSRPPHATAGPGARVQGRVW